MKYLTATDNEAAVRVLTAALDSSHPAIQEGALTALLSRRNPAGGREILQRMPKFKPQWKAIVGRHHGRMTGALRDAILGRDPAMCRNGCQATVWFREYDLIPTLLSALEDRDRPHVEAAARALLELVGHLYEELAGKRDPTDRRDPQIIRHFAVSSLERSVQRFGRHKRREVVESFLLLVGRENAILKQILQNPHHAAFLAAIDVLSKSARGGVIRLLLGFLDDPAVPSAALSVIAGRSDARFVQHLLRKVDRDCPAAVAQNLKRVENIPWLRGTAPLLGQLDDACQQAAVRLAMGSGISRLQAFDVVRHVLLHGKTAGRRQAALALAEFQGADANALAVQSLADPDPQVQANLACQLRGRGIGNVLTELLELVDSPHEVVRNAARDSLTEFSFKRYLGAFDTLDDSARRSTGMLVKKIDTQTLPLLEVELKSPVRARRLRGLAIARTLEIVETLVQAVIILLGDEDHVIRFEAASALASSRSAESRRALQAALADTSEIVRQAAQRSLQEAGFPA